MVLGDWLSIGLTVLLTLGLLVGTRYFKAHYAHNLPKWQPVPVLLVYNAILTVVVLFSRYSNAFALPEVVAPVAFIGGNAVLMHLFGIPQFGRAKKAAAPPTDPNRARIVPTAKKRRQKRRK